jgi:hypothetical protein
MELFGAFIGIIIIMIGLMSDGGAFKSSYSIDWKEVKERERGIYYESCRELYPNEEDLAKAFDEYWKRYCDHEQRMYRHRPDA